MMGMEALYGCRDIGGFWHSGSICIADEGVRIGRILVPYAFQIKRALQTVNFTKKPLSDGSLLVYFW